MIKRMLKLIYPPRCVICDRVLSIRSSGCCPACYAALPRADEPVCMKCGKPLTEWEAEYCGDCHGTPHLFEEGRAVFAYQGRIRASISRIKFHNRRDYIDFYAKEMYRAGALYIRRWNPGVIIPVPMYPPKKRKRGYNQAELLARELGKYCKVPVNTSLVHCVRWAKEQKTLDRKARMANLRGCFYVDPKEKLCDTVLIVDDVYTTGSTMDAMSSALKQAGVKRVFFLVLCTGKGKRRYAQ